MVLVLVYFQIEYNSTHIHKTDNLFLKDLAKERSNISEGENRVHLLRYIGYKDSIPNK